MGKLIILRGISGSGKSTWTAAHKEKNPEEKILVVNRDKIRELCFGSESDHGVDEHLVTVIQDTMVASASRKGYTIILDNTNIEPDLVRPTIHLCPSDTEIQVVMMPIDLARAKLLNTYRERRVPEDVIEKQYKRLLETKDWKP